MKNSDLTTIISGVLGVVLLAMATVVLLYAPAYIVFAGSLVVGALGLNGYNAALLAPSPKQGEQIAQAVAAAAPQVPLVNIVHPASSAPDIQVSSAAMPKVEQQGPRPIVLQPTAPQPMTSAAEQNLPPRPIPFPQQQGQQQQGDWRNWTAMTEVPPTQQQ